MADNIYQEIDQILTNLIQELNDLQENVDNGDFEDEMEERVDKNITNLDKYIIKIIFCIYFVKKI